MTDNFTKIGKRSAQGTYHLGWIRTRGTCCNQRLNSVAARLSYMEKASPSMFCDKCFPNGKPEAADIARLCTVPAMLTETA